MPPRDFTTHLAEGHERDDWWGRAVSVFAPYAEYAERTARVIPVFVATPA